MRLRREPMLVISLILLSVSALTASVLVALTGLSRGVVNGPITTVPEILLAKEEVQVRVAPVRQEIEGEASPGASSEQSSSPKPPRQSAPKQTAKPPAPAPVPALAISLEGVRTDRSPKDVITYTATVKSVGTASVGGIRFASHVPAETVWETGECNGAGLPVYITYSGEGTSIICVPGPSQVQGAGDAIHQVELTLSKSLA
ncbi:MAG: hypothetical protein ACRD1T_23590, partial [Acidimicrobiia bacterium]